MSVPKVMSWTSVGALAIAVAFVLVAAVPWESANGGSRGSGSVPGAPLAPTADPGQAGAPSDERYRDDRTIVPESVPARGSLTRPRQ